MIIIIIKLIKNIFLCFWGSPLFSTHQAKQISAFVGSDLQAGGLGRAALWHRPSVAGLRGRAPGNFRTLRSRALRTSAAGFGDSVCPGPFQRLVPQKRGPEFAPRENWAECEREGFVTDPFFRNWDLREEAPQHQLEHFKTPIASDPKEGPYENTDFSSGFFSRPCSGPKSYKSN